MAVGTAGKTTILVCVSLFLTLALAEISLRTLEWAGAAPRLFAQLGNAKPPLDTRSGAGMYYVHPYSSYAMKPGYTKREFEKINNVGFRGDDVIMPKPDNTYRVVAIGGSTTFGVYLPYTMTYPHYLQAELRKRFAGTGINIEVFNAGLSGSTSAESLHRLFTEVLPVDPDMVVIYHGYNDLFPRVFDDFQDDYFHFRRANPNNPPGMTRFITYRLALLVLNPVAFHENYDLQNHVWKTQNLPESDSDRLTNFFTSDESAYESNLVQMVKVLEANNIQPVLATMANHRDGVHWNDFIPSYAWEEGINQNNRAAHRVAEQYGVPLVPFAEQGDQLPHINIWRQKPTEGCCFSDSIHMTPEGNVIKARIFADTIEPLIAKSLAQQ
jgi:lysophospholipase L1-like esterase